MRLFAALPVGEPARAEVLKLLNELRVTGWPVRWVQDDGLHVTLKFFGQVPDDRLDAIGSALAAAAAGAGPLPLRVSGLGGFPTPTRARVLWAGIEGPAGLELLQDAVERRCTPLGYPPEGRAFRPHLTLGRLREGQRIAAGALDPFRERLAPTEFLVEELILYQSRLSPRGARYEPQLRLRLGG